MILENRNRLIPMPGKRMEKNEYSYRMFGEKIIVIHIPSRAQKGSCIGFR